MKAAVIIVIVAFMFADTFLMWCLLRANALYGQNENGQTMSWEVSDGREATSNETKDTP